MKYTVSFFKSRIKYINDGLEKENYIQRLRTQYVMEKGQLTKVAFYYRPVHQFGVLKLEQIMTVGLPVKLATLWLDKFDPKAHGFELAKEEKFVNGFDSWHAVHFEMAKQIDIQVHGSQAYFRMLMEGRQGVYDLAREMTDKLELENKEEQTSIDLANGVQAFCLMHNI